MKSNNTYMRWARRVGIGALVTLPLLGAGCASEQDPINRVQPNVLDKSFFVGADLTDFRDDPQFQTKSFNVDSDVNADNFAGTIGGASAIDRIRFEITEGMLFVRRSFQENPKADNKGLERVKNAAGKWEFPGPPNGTIIGAFPILAHFDVRRDYNAATGEESNIIVENTDKPWHQRKNMRVDWSKNVASSTSGDISWVFGGTSPVKAIAFSPTDRGDDAPHIEAAKGYFDVTLKYQVEPDSTEFGVPECVVIGYFNGSSTFDCTPPEVKSRMSFVRMDGEEDFESFEENIAPRDIIGNWGNAGTTFNREYGGPPRTAFDPQYGYTDKNTKTFFALHNIWEKSHSATACTVNTDANNDGTADECSEEPGSKGSQCDINLKRCTIPVRDRAVKTMGWWLNKETPSDFLDEVNEDGSLAKQGSIEEMTTTWSQLFAVSVAYRREVECRRTNDGSREACHEQYFEKEKQMVRFGGWGTDTPKALDVDQGRPVVTTCHNPVRSYDPSICGAAGSDIRLGDLRKNYIIYWPFNSRAPYGGVASIAGDPLTGEMLGATATIMGRSVTFAAAQVRDIIQLAMGDLKIEDLIQGSQPLKFADRVKDGRVTDPVEMQSFEQNLAAIDMESVRNALPSAGAASPLIDSRIESIQHKLSLKLDGPDMVAADARVKKLIDRVSASPVAKQGSFGSRPIDQMVDGLKARATNAQQKGFADNLANVASMDSDKMSNLYTHYMSYIGQRGVCFHDSLMAAPAGSIYSASLGAYFKKKYGSDSPKERGIKIYKELASEIIKGIGFHELGHAVGMRHNFASSWDAMNFMPQYWQLRTDEQTEDPACLKDPASPGCKDLRAVKPYTNPKLDGEGKPVFEPLLDDKGKPIPGMFDMSKPVYEVEKADPTVGPRYSDPYTPDELGEAGEPRPGVDYFGNTSTMEYQVERFGETAGAGTYDLHFIKTLYGRVVETFDQNVVRSKDQRLFAGKMLSQTVPDDLVSEGGDAKTIKTSAHYTRTARQARLFDAKRDCRAATGEEKEHAKWRIVHGKLCAQPPKNHIGYNDFLSDELTLKTGKEASFPVGAGTRWHAYEYGSNGKTELVRWNYRYGEDYGNYGYMHAKPGDAGADIFEITTNAIRRYDLTYPWTYFRRLNKEYAWWSIPNSANGTFAKLRGYHWNAVGDLRGAAANLRDDDLAKPSVQAAAAMFAFFQRVILTPQPGTYWPEEEGRTKSRTPSRAGAPLIVDQVDCSKFEGGVEGGRAQECKGQSFNIPLMDGRYLETTFDTNLGGAWDFEQFPTYVGFNNEKVMAIRQLVDSRPTLSTVSRDNALDNRGVYISWRSDLPNAVDRLLGAMLSEDWELIAPSFKADNTLENLPITGAVATIVRPADAKVVFPNIGYSHQVDAAIYAMLLSKANSDLVLVNKLRINFDNDSGTLPAGARRISFINPETGYRYLATRFGTEVILNRTVEKGIASRMLTKATELAADAYEVLPPDAGGEVAPKLVNGMVVVKDARAAQKLRSYVSLLDAVRQLGLILGNGPLGGAGGDE
jgi:hypothetical protein